MKYDKAKVLKELEHGRNIVGWTSGASDRRLIKYNGRKYTVIGSHYAIKGDYFDNSFEQIKSISPRYGFEDWDNLSGMYKDEY